MAAQVAANAQKMGIDVVYFDSESAIDPKFLESTGCDLSHLLYVQATSVELVLETIEELLSSENQMLFIWDSLALTPAISDVEGDFNPQSSMAVKARILAKAMAKLTVSIANANATLLILNQLKTNITRSPSEVMTTPYVTPGGKAVIYAYSLRIWLTGRKAKASFVTDENGFRIGSEVKVKIEKSRFGTQGRQCNFKILWGGDRVEIQDDESLFDAVKGSSRILQSGAWYALLAEDGTQLGQKFQATRWSEKMKEEEFRKTIFQIIDEEIIHKFDKRIGKAENFYDTGEKE
jgi:RecA/RadA recombinase